MDSEILKDLAEKKSIENYRVKRFQTGLVAEDDECQVSKPRKLHHIIPDTDRVVIHFDVDAFYAQVEEVRNPAFKEQPLAITQKYLVVTCNYLARQRGVTKLMATTNAKKICPGLALVSGEDLTPYRNASKKILSVIKRFGVAEKLGMDEIFLDVTKEAHERMSQMNSQDAVQIVGHVHLSSNPVHQDSAYRPMDLRSSKEMSDHKDQYWCDVTSGGTGWKLLLAVGSAIAADVRKAVKTETGFRCSAGIAGNKQLAKLSSGLHKPDDQTILPPTEAAEYVAPLPVRALPGVGHKMDKQLQEAGIKTAADLRDVDSKTLVQMFGEKTAEFLYEVSRGRDQSPVKERGPPKSMTVEDSFKPCSAFKGLENVVCVLAPDLVARFSEEYEENGRWPKTMTVKWRQRGRGWKRTSASRPFPPGFQPTQSEHDQVSVVANMAKTILSNNLTDGFSVTMVNLGGTNFEQHSESVSRPVANSHRITEFINKTKRCVGSGGDALDNVDQQPSSTGQLPECAAHFSMQSRRDYGTAAQRGGVLLSKREERMVREQNFGNSAGSVEKSNAKRKQNWADDNVIQKRLRVEGDVDLDDDDLNVVVDSRTDGKSWASQILLQASCMGDIETASNEPSVRTMLCGSVNAHQGVRQKEDSLCREWKPGGPQVDTQRVIVHCDVDCFYCEVERLDDPSLRGRPVAVRQFNSGGFVSVSYEARAAGVRCGDGVGAGGRANIPSLIKMEAVSLEEAKRRCPGLIVKPMRTDRYRKVAQSIKLLLSTIAAASVVEKASYDDFYVDVSTACCGEFSTSQTLAPNCRIEGGGQFTHLSDSLKRGVQIADKLRQVVKSKLGMTLSCGVARNKLLARLVGPLNKPNGLTVLPDDRVLHFIRAMPIQCIPSLRKKFGAEIRAKLGISLVGELAGFSVQDLAVKFGENKAVFLKGLVDGRDNRPVVENEPQKSISCERSYPPTSGKQEICALIKSLGGSLWQRISEDFQEHGRVPARLSISWRENYSQTQTKACSVPHLVKESLHKSFPSQELAEEAPGKVAGELTGVAYSVLKKCMGEPKDITRLVLSAGYEDKTGTAQQNCVGVKQKTILSYAAKSPSGSKPDRKCDDSARHLVRQPREKELSTLSRELARLKELERCGDQETGVPETSADYQLAWKLQKEELNGRVSRTGTVSSKKKRKGTLDAFIVRGKKDSGL